MISYEKRKLKELRKYNTPNINIRKNKINSNHHHSILKAKNELLNKYKKSQIN